MPQAAASTVDTAKTVLSFQSKARNNFLQYLSKLASVEKSVIDDLSLQTEEQIIEIRKKAGQLAESSWRIQCACDYILLRVKSVPQPKGRGHKDVRGLGPQAAAERRAKQVGCLPRQIQRNVQIFELMQSIQTTEANQNDVSANAILTTLKDKAFYNVALAAYSPQNALAEFAQQKESDPKFNASDAYRFLESTGKLRAKKNEEILQNVRSPERQNLIAHVRKIQVKAIELAELLKTCPDQKLMERLFPDGVISIQDIRDELRDFFDDDACELVKQSWLRGKCTAAELASDSGLSADEVVHYLRRMEDTFFPVGDKWQMVGQPLLPELTGAVDQQFNAAESGDDDPFWKN